MVFFLVFFFLRCQRNIIVFARTAVILGSLRVKDEFYDPEYVYLKGFVLIDGGV